MFARIKFPLHLIKRHIMTAYGGVATELHTSLVSCLKDKMVIFMPRPAAFRAQCPQYPFNTGAEASLESNLEKNFMPIRDPYHDLLVVHPTG